MKQMVAETKLDEDHDKNTTRITDKEIEERLAKLKDLDPSEGKYFSFNSFIFYRHCQTEHILVKSACQYPSFV